jgi:hypothetical protein
MRADLQTRPANDVGETRSMRLEPETRPASDIEEFLSLLGKVIIAFVMLSLLAVGLDLGRVMVLAVAGTPMCALVTVLILAIKKG